MDAIQRGNTCHPVHSVHRAVQPLEDGGIVADMQLEMATRLNPLMNRERLKAMVMMMASQGDTGIVGFWSDD